MRVFALYYPKQTLLCQFLHRLSFAGHRYCSCPPGFAGRHCDLSYNTTSSGTGQWKQLAPSGVGEYSPSLLAPYIKFLQIAKTVPWYQDK